MKIYLDSNVLISLIREEIGKKFRLLYSEAELFFRLVSSNQNTLVLSRLFFKEINTVLNLDKDAVLDFLSTFSLIIEEYAPKEISDPAFFEKLGIHYPDSLHLVLAIESKCDCLVTFNKKDFVNAEKFIPVREPSDFS